MAYRAPPPPHTGSRPQLFQGTLPGTSGRNLARSAPVTNTLGWHTNGTINYAYVVRQLKGGVDKSLRAGQLVFLKVDTEPIGNRLYTMLNVPMMNTYLRKMFEKLRRDPDETEFQNAMSIDAIAREWAPIGFIVGERGQEEGVSGLERLINVTVAGRALVSNMWYLNKPNHLVARVKDGMELYMELYETDAKSDRYRTDVRDWDKLDYKNWENDQPPDDRDDVAGRKLCQFRAYAHPHPTDSNYRF